jgi:hypothetical protein
MSDNITSTQLKQLLDYDPETGVFTWKQPGEFHKSKKGKQAGFVGGKKPEHLYRRIGVAGRIYMASHLAWLWVHRYLPDCEVLHGEKGSQNDSIANLRLRTP